MSIWDVPRSRRFDSVSIAAFRSFVAVVESKGFAPASRRLSLAVSTISKHVEVLEARLETSLLLRTTRQVTLTDAGNRLYVRCKSVLDQLDDVAVRSLKAGELCGRLRIVSPPDFANCILSPNLPDFLERHPELQVELRTSSAKVEFLQGDVDVAIRMTPDQASGNIVELAGGVPSLLCASPDYIARAGRPEQPGELAGHRCLGGIGSPYSDNWQFIVENELVELSVKCSLLADTGTALREACLRGLGIGGFYRVCVQEDISAGRLIPILQECQADVCSVYIVWPASRYVSPSVLAFASFVRGLLNSGRKRSLVTSVGSNDDAHAHAG